MQQQSHRLALRVSLIYGLIGAAWIIGSDWLVAVLVPHADRITHFQTYKGWAFIGVTAALLFVVLRLVLRRGEHETQERQRAEQVRRESEERFQALVNFSPDAVYLHVEGRITFANPAMCRLLGATAPAQLLGKSVFDIVHPDFHAVVRERWETIFADQPVPPLEEKFVRLDGTAVEVEVKAVGLKFQGHQEVQVIARDITRRKRQERELNRLNRLYAALSEVNQAIVQVRTRTELFQEVCRVVVEHGGFCMAWIGWNDPTQHQLVPVAQWGDENNYLANLKIYTDDRLEACGPSGTAFREARPYICNDYFNDPGTRVWWAEARRRGIAASAVFPFRLQGEVVGTLNVYANEAGIFQDKEVALLAEAAGDVSFALDNFVREEERHRAEAALREGELRQRELAERLTAAQAIGKVGSWETDLATMAVNWSEQAHRIFETTPVTFKPTHPAFVALVHPEDRALVDQAFRDSLSQTDSAALEHRLLLPSGRTKIVEERWRVFRDDQGRPVRAVGTVQDITERKQAEKKLEASRGQLRALIARLQRVQEAERTRVAREIHDELGQLLTGLKMDVRWLEKKLSAPDLAPALNPLLDRAVAASELVDTAIATVQKIAAELRPGALDKLGLAAALTQRARRFQERSGIHCTVIVSEPDAPLPPEVATELFYIAQEALTNVARHAQAQNVEIRLTIEPEATGLEICDDGVGITEADQNAAGSLGLLGMKERVTHCAGSLVIERGSPGGTRISVRIPRRGTARPEGDIP